MSTTKTWTKEKDCVESAKGYFDATKEPQLIFRKGRKYIHITGPMHQVSKNTFKNAFGEEVHYKTTSDIRLEYEKNGYELRGWVSARGCFKNN